MSSPSPGPAGSAPRPDAQGGEIRDAATVMVLRDGAETMQTFLLRRQPTMRFAAGMSVFPGGGVDPRDLGAAVRWHGPDADWWADRFDCPPRLAAALLCAAIRETFEEVGVLLAGTASDGVAGGGAARGYRRERAALEARELAFTDFLTAEGLGLRTDLLRPWARWITPPGEPRRYDTRFFAAALPDGQRAEGHTSEATSGEWIAPDHALQQARDGRRWLMPPTLVALRELAAFRSVEQVLAAERQIEPVAPDSPQHAMRMFGEEQR